MRYSLPLSIVFFLCTSAQTAWACKSDMDCKGSRICQANQCVDPNPSQIAPAQPSSASAPASPHRADATKSISLNVLGPLQLGLNPTWEWGHDVTSLFRLRFLNTGALPYLLAAWEDSTFYTGLGVSAGAHVYLKDSGGQTGLYVGALAEYLVTAARYEDVDVTHFIAPQIEIGYRWPDARGEGFSGVGAFFGGGIPVAASYDNPESILVAGLVWEEGWWQ